MSKTITVANRAQTSVRIQEPNPKPDGEVPSNAATLRHTVLNGANHPSARGGAGITHDVDADLFHAWADDAKHHNPELHALVSEVPDDYAGDEAALYGFEPGLERARQDAENTEAASKGTEVKEPGPVSSDEMAATSDTPNDDSPRSQTDLT